MADKTMKPTVEVLKNIRKISLGNSNQVFTKLYRYLLRPDIYYLAYKNLYANNGAATRGINDDTADGFSKARVDSIIQSLKDGSYMPTPVRRTYIPKRNGKMRPLGIPTFTDKLVQEALRLILEAVYEPIFSDCSHGFRPGRSCHTALASMTRSFTGVRWFIEGDIKGFFDHIDHATLVKLVGKKVKDARISQLLFKMLRAGYMENWKFNRTLSGTPQGGIISPLLANIYLHELDVFVSKIKEDFDQPSMRKRTPEYMKIAARVHYLSKQIAHYDLSEEEKLNRIAERNSLRKQMMTLPSKAQTDKRLVYVRYADDFLIGVCGNKQECEHIKLIIKQFLSVSLKLDLSDEKTLITHSSNYARFLGYDVRVRRNSQIKGGGHKWSQRTLNGSVELAIPLKEKIESYLFNRKAAVWKDGALAPTSRGALVTLTDLEILMIYNTETRGICNYYALAANYNCLQYFAYLMEYSCLMTLASKHKSTISKVRAQFRDGHGSWCIKYSTKAGPKQMYFAKIRECRKSPRCKDVIPKAVPMAIRSRNSFESRLNAKCCEYCGRTDSKRYEVHHVHKLKDVKGKTMIEQVMIARKRKTIVLCVECHQALHQGKLNL